PDRPLPRRGRRAEDHGPGDVALVAVERAPAVDEHHIATSERPWLRRSVGERRVRAEEDEGAALDPQALVGFAAQDGRLGLRHPDAERGEDCAMGPYRDL